MNNSEFALLGRAGQRVLRLYHLYRLLIGLALVLLLSTNFESQLFNLAHTQLFSFGSWAYLIFNTLVILAMPRAERLLPLFALALADVLSLSLLYYAAGGTPSGIGNLIVVAVALANILLYRNIGLVIAATGAAGIIYLTFYLSLSHHEATNQFMQAGVLGMLCFAAALGVQALSRKLVTSEQLLQFNQAALNMLESRDLSNILLRDYYPALIQAYEHWQKNPAITPPSLQFSAQSPQMQPGFVIHRMARETQLLVFLEDTRYYNQQAQQLKLASLGRLAAGIAHEIRNPLGAISHAAQLLGESETLDRADQRLSQIIQEQSHRLNHVIENVLQLSRQQKPEPQLLDLKYWVHRYTNAYRESSQPGHILKLQVSGNHLNTRMDPYQLNQILDNLVGNAMRHTTSRDGKRIVELSLFRHPSLLLPVLEVRDYGPGVPPDEQDALFEPFYTTEKQGTGLGLYISRELCEGNQARLDYIDQPGGGCFRITFAHPKSFGLQK